MKLPVSLTVCLCAASTTATIFNQKPKLPKKVKPPKEAGGQFYLSVNPDAFPGGQAYVSLSPAPVSGSVRLPIGELPLYKQRHLYKLQTTNPTNFKLPISGLGSQPTPTLPLILPLPLPHLTPPLPLPLPALPLPLPLPTPHLHSVSSTFSENAFALEKDTFYLDPKPHVSKNTFVQNPGPLPQDEALASAPAKPIVTKVVAVTHPQRPVTVSLPERPVAVFLPTNPQRPVAVSLLKRPVAVSLPKRPVAVSLPKFSSVSSSTQPQRSAPWRKHYFDVLNTRAIYSGWLEPSRPRKKESKEEKSKEEKSKKN